MREHWPRDGASRHHQNPPAVIMSHARSGAALLLEFLQQDPDMWTAFEPLQDVRQMPPFLEKVRAGRCRDSTNPDAAMRSACPMRDSTVLLALAACDMSPLLSTWYQEHDLSGGRAQWIPHRNELPGSEWRTTHEVPELAHFYAEKLAQKRTSCLEKQRHALKTIRLNGHLDMLWNVSKGAVFAEPLVLQVVRDPRAVYASRKQLENARSIGMPRLRGDSVSDPIGVQNWARLLCTATLRDTEVGAARGRLYERVNFSELISSPREVMRRIYSRHYRRHLPSEVLAYVDDWLEKNRNVRNRPPHKCQCFQCRQCTPPHLEMKTHVPSFPRRFADVSRLREGNR